MEDSVFRIALLYNLGDFFLRSVVPKLTDLPDNGKISMNEHVAPLITPEGLLKHSLLLPLVYLLVALPLVLFLAFFRQPIGVADEWSHFARAAQIAEGGILTEEAKPGLPPKGSIDPNFGTFLTQVHQRRKERLATALLDFEKHKWSDQRVLVDYNSAVYFPAPYIISAIAYKIGRLKGATIVQTLRLSNLLNGLACIFAAALAIAITPKGRLAIFLVAILPMTLHQSVSSSPDGPLISSSLLILAILVRSATLRAVSHQGMSGVTFLSIVIAATKLPYLPLVLAAMAVVWLSATDFRPGRGAFLAYVLALLSVSLGWNYISNAGVIDITGGEKIGNPPQQIMFLLTHPIAALRISALTMKELGTAYFQEMVGFLGWQDAPISLLGQKFFLAALAVIIFCDGADLVVRLRWLAAAGIVFATGAILLAVYVAMNKVGSLGPIIGVQGRYFLPILPFLVLLTPRVNRWRTGLAALTIAASVVSNFEIISTEIHRYYL